MAIHYKKLNKLVKATTVALASFYRKLEYTFIPVNSDNRKQVDDKVECNIFLRRVSEILTAGDTRHSVVNEYTIKITDLIYSFTVENHINMNSHVKSGNIRIYLDLDEEKEIIKPIIRFSERYSSYFNEWEIVCVRDYITCLLINMFKPKGIKVWRNDVIHSKELSLRIKEIATS